MGKILLGKVFWIFDFGHFFCPFLKIGKYFPQKLSKRDHKNFYGKVPEKIILKV
jgi:hypothetical protein